MLYREFDVRKAPRMKAINLEIEFGLLLIYCGNNLIYYDSIERSNSVLKNALKGWKLLIPLKELGFTELSLLREPLRRVPIPLKKLAEYSVNSPALPG
jgi:hypothetical protein